MQKARRINVTNGAVGIVMLSTAWYRHNVAGKMLAKMFAWFLVYGITVGVEYTLVGEPTKAWWAIRAAIGAGLAIVYLLISPKLNKIEQEYNATDGAASTTSNACPLKVNKENKIETRETQ